jgi:hypothetical protein
MRLLANGEEVLFRADEVGPPQQQYWLYSVWGDGEVTVDGVVCRGTNAKLYWKFEVIVELAGEWRMDPRSGAMQDTFEHILWTMEEAGVPKGLSWREEHVGPCADPYCMTIEAAPVEWHILKA